MAIFFCCSEKVYWASWRESQATIARYIFLLEQMCFKLNKRGGIYPRKDKAHKLQKHPTDNGTHWFFCYNFPTMRSSSIYQNDSKGVVKFCKQCERLFASLAGNQKVYPMSLGHGEKMNKGSGTRPALYIASNLSSHFCPLPQPLIFALRNEGLMFRRSEKVKGHS